MNEDFDTISEYLNRGYRYYNRPTIPPKESEEEKRRKRRERRRERMQDLQDILTNWLLTTLLLILCLILVAAMIGGLAMAIDHRNHCDDDARIDSVPTRTRVPTPHVTTIPVGGKLMPIVTAN